MTLIVFAQENYAQYADFVNQHESSTPYHSLAWVKAVESSYGYSPKVLGLFDENKLVAVLPCVLITSLKGSRVLCSLPYCDLGGALATEPHQKDSIFKSLL